MFTVGKTTHNTNIHEVYDMPYAAPLIVFLFNTKRGSFLSTVIHQTMLVIV
jgi:hypothetical protein